MRSFYHIKEDLKKIMGIPSDRFLAEDLGVKYDNLRNRVTRNSIPFKEVLDFCNNKGLDAMKILYGEVQNGN